MEFYEFAQKLVCAIGNTDNQARFTKSLLESIVTDKGQEIVNKYKIETYKKYFNGKTKINRIAGKIASFLEPDEFATFLKNCSYYAEQQMVDEFSPYIENLSTENVIEKLADFFCDIILKASQQKTKDSHKNSKKAEQDNYLCKESSLNNNFLDYINENYDDFFVETSYYKQAKSSLESKKIVILIGQPGTGKTITSKKIAQDFESRGYRIYYSEEANIDNANALLKDLNSQEKKLIVLNDFLGQFYTDLKLSPDTSGLSKLISIIKQLDNVKILINTRGIIYQEAKQSTKFDATINNNLTIEEIIIEDMSHNEKAMILYSHLKRAHKEGYLTEEYLSRIIGEKSYERILNHKNFNPRIIEYTTRKDFLVRITDPINYVEQVVKALDNPKEIWKEEYEKLESFDRMLLNTLFSLTNTNVPLAVLEKALAKRQKQDNIDTTINYFENSVSRLRESVVKVIEVNNEERIGITYSSLNDFLFAYIKTNSKEQNEILEHALYFEQIEKLLSCGLDKTKLIGEIKSNLFDRLSTYQKIVFPEYDIYATTPPYLYKLEILLIHLRENELEACGITRDEIQNMIVGLFQENFSSIEQYSRLYFTSYFSNIFGELFKKESGYDLISIINNEEYFNVILRSISDHDDFWDILSNIKTKYFPTLNDDFYTLKNVKSAIVERVKTEVFIDMHNEINDFICFQVEDKINSLQNDDSDYIIEEIYNAMLSGLQETIKDSILEKLEEHNIGHIDEEYDIYSKINDEIRPYEIIEQRYNDYKNKQK